MRGERVSIVITNFNYARFLNDSIGSALAQAYANKEVLVVDDGSTDDSAELIACFGDAIVPVMKANGGQLDSYMAGLERATGDIVLFLDADDVLDPSACDEIVAAFTPATTKVHFRLRLIDCEGRPLGGIIPRQLSSGDLREMLLEKGRFYASAPGSGNAYRRRTLQRLMPFPCATEDNLGADFFAMYGVSLLGEVRIAGPRALGGYRVHNTDAQRTVKFGNTAQGQGLCEGEPERSLARYTRMRVWLGERLGEHLKHARPAIDFSIAKNLYADHVLSTPDYVRRLVAGGRYLVTHLLPAIGAREGSRLEQVGLAGWAVAVLVLPRAYSMPVARYLCNPGSRGAVA